MTATTAAATTTAATSQHPSLYHYHQHHQIHLHGSATIEAGNSSKISLHSSKSSLAATNTTTSPASLIQWRRVVEQHLNGNGFLVSFLRNFANFYARHLKVET